MFDDTRISLILRVSMCSRDLLRVLKRKGTSFTHFKRPSALLKSIFENRSESSLKTCLACRTSSGKVKKYAILGTDSEKQITIA